MKKVQVEAIRLTAAELSEWLDLSPGRITQLTDQGVLERGDDKHYDWHQSLSQYALFTQNPKMFSDW
jgi:hypothetical protein